MFIQTEDTPNPSTVKFIPGVDVLGIGTKDFASVEDTASSPLAKRLFGLTGVSRVFLGDSFVSISKDDNTDWSMLKPMVLALLMDHFSTNQPVMIESIQSTKPDEQDDEITSQIKILLDERVRPMVARDGGDIVFERFEGGIVYLKMHGACAGCPSSTATLKSGVENMLKHFVPEVIEVRQSMEY